MKDNKPNTDNKPEPDSIRLRQLEEENRLLRQLCKSQQETIRKLLDNERRRLEK